MPQNVHAGVFRPLNGLSLIIAFQNLPVVENGCDDACQPRVGGSNRSPAAKKAFVSDKLAWLGRPAQERRPRFALTPLVCA